MNKVFLSLIFTTILLASCSDDSDNGPSIDNPETYSFERNGQSTVSFTGQTTRIQMAEELISAMMDFSTSEALQLEMYRNETADGGDANPYSDPALNADSKNIKSKVAASRDFFFTNTSTSSIIKADFEEWISGQANEVFPNENTVAAPGIAGQIADGSSTRFVNSKGLEYNQLVAKSLIGALMADQMLNNYLGTAVLDEADNRASNDSELLEDGTNYTTMEHKWDEAYGYLYGTSADKTNPNASIGSDDSFLNKYIGRAENDNDFAGIADEIFEAFKLGRAAIVARDYTIRDQQAQIIREKISEVIAIRALHYLQAGKNALPDARDNTALYGSAFHGLSEGYGFIYSLQFTRQPGTDLPYFTHSEVNAMLEKLMGDGDNGLWDVEPTTLDELSEEIVAKFQFTIDQAAN
ncbi:DUF4856 domain-containing protein [Fulvivirga sp.]|uniref:DUF4856 domain-containing protein n=1 Tax=Fulvivirga sp. TaxID=1931237 RepID=UPI0032ED19C6